MVFVYWAIRYLAVGAIFMLILDLLHRMVINKIDEEFKEGYKNWERIYIIFTWPFFLYSVIKEIVISKNNIKSIISMDVNFKLIKPDGTEIVSDTINWVTWNVDGGGLRAAHDGPAEGRSLVMDMKTIPMDVLLTMSQNNFEGMKDIKVKDPYKFLSEPITKVIESTKSKVIFETEKDTFELLINTNPAWVKPRSPFSLR